MNGDEQRQVVTRPTAMVAVEQSRAAAEVQAAMQIARMCPRDEVQARDMILQDCTNPKLAEGATYDYARGGTSIVGPSIRLAEVMARRWGHIECGVKELSRADGYSECMAYAIDLQTGFRDVKTFQVRHWRDTKSGGYKITDERDIYELTANMGARRKRACILSVLPGDIVDDAVHQCEVTLGAKGEITPERLKALVSKFAEFGVTQEQIEKRIQRRIDAITPALLVQLGKIHNSLRDEMSKPADWFEVTATDAEGTKTTGNEGAKAAMKKRAAPTPTGSPGEPPKQPEQPKPQPTIHDALKLVNEKRYDEASELVKGAPFNDVDRTEIKVAIGRHKTTGERV